MSKILNISQEEKNRILEMHSLGKNVISEELVEQEDENARHESRVNLLIEQGYKVVPKFNLPDGEYELSGWGYVCNVNKDGKNTGYAYVTTGGIRGSWGGQTVQIKNGQIENVMYGKVYKILFNQSKVGKPKEL